MISYGPVSPKDLPPANGSRRWISRESNSARDAAGLRSKKKRTKLRRMWRGMAATPVKVNRVHKAQGWQSLGQPASRRPHGLPTVGFVCCPLITDHCTLFLRRHIKTQQYILVANVQLAVRN